MNSSNILGEKKILVKWVVAPRFEPGFSALPTELFGHRQIVIFQKNLLLVLIPTKYLVLFTNCPSTYVSKGKKNYYGRFENKRTPQIFATLHFNLQGLDTWF